MSKERPWENDAIVSPARQQATSPSGQQFVPDDPIIRTSADTAGNVAFSQMEDFRRLDTHANRQSDPRYMWRMTNMSDVQDAERLFREQEEFYRDPQNKGKRPAGGAGLIQRSSIDGQVLVHPQFADLMLQQHHRQRASASQVQEPGLIEDITRGNIGQVEAANRRRAQFDQETPFPFGLAERGSEAFDASSQAIDAGQQITQSAPVGALTGFVRGSNRLAADVLGGGTDLLATGLEMVFGLDQSGAHEQARRYRERFQAVADQYEGSEGINTFQPSNWRWWTESIAEQTPAFGAMMAPGLGVGGALARAGAGARATQWISAATTAGTSFGIEASMAYEDIYQRMLELSGGDEQAAHEIAAVEAASIGAINAVLETVGFGELILRNKEGMGMLQRAMRNFFTEGLTEGLQEVTPVLAQAVVENNADLSQSFTVQEIEQILAGALLGGVMGAGVGAATPGSSGLDQTQQAGMGPIIDHFAGPLVDPATQRQGPDFAPDATFEPPPTEATASDAQVQQLLETADSLPTSELPQQAEPAPIPEEFAQATFEEPTGPEPDPAEVERLADVFEEPITPSEESKTPLSELKAGKGESKRPYQESPSKDLDATAEIARVQAAILDSPVYISEQSDGTFKMDQRMPDTITTPTVRVMPSGDIQQITPQESMAGLKRAVGETPGRRKGDELPSRDEVPDDYVRDQKPTIMTDAKVGDVYEWGMWDKEVPNQQKRNVTDAWQVTKVSKSGMLTLKNLRTGDTETVNNNNYGRRLTKRKTAEEVEQMAAAAKKRDAEAKPSDKLIIRELRTGRTETLDVPPAKPSRKPEPEKAKAPSVSKGDVIKPLVGVSTYTVEAVDANSVTLRDNANKKAMSWPKDQFTREFGEQPKKVPQVPQDGDVVRVGDELESDGRRYQVSRLMPNEVELDDLTSKFPISRLMRRGEFYREFGRTLPLAEPPTQAAEPPTEPRTQQGYGETNKVVKKDAYEAALKKLREKLSSNPQFDPELLSAGATVAAYHIEAGARKFADFAARMVRDVGDNIIPYLKSVYNGARDMPGMDDVAKDMTPADEVSGLSLHRIREMIRQENERVQETQSTGTEQGTRGTEPASDAGAIEAGTGTDAGQPGVVAGDAVLAGEAGVVEGERPATAERVADAGGTGTDRPSGGSVEQSGEGGSTPAAGRPAKRAGRGKRDGRRGAGDAGRAEGVGAAGTDDAGPGSQVREEAGEPEADLSVAGMNYRAPADQPLVPRGEMAKVDANLKALDLLRRLEEADRNATPEEKATLAQFSGWGGLRPLFDEQKARYVERVGDEYLSTSDQEWKKKWKPRRDKLMSLLTPEEYRAAFLSIENAHYTSKEVIQHGLWAIAERLGFKGGNVLENSAGIGHVIGLTPDSVAGSTRWTAVEMDAMSARLLRKLYPQANVQHGQFEDVNVKPNSMDMVIGNFPFSAQTISKPGIPKFNTHNFFFAKSIQSLKPGGFIVAITSDSTMDRSASQEFRKWALERADLVGAIRLPNTAFKANAGTEVTTDIIILRKRDGQGFSDAQAWLETVPVQGKNADGEPVDVFVNEYFKEHPGMALGEHGTAGTMYRADQYALTPTPGADLTTQLDQAVQNLPMDIAEFNAIETAEIQQDQAASGAPEYSYTVDGKEVWQTIDGVRVKPEWYASPLRASRIKRLKAWTGVRDAAQEAVNVQLSDEASDADIEASRVKLNKVYDDFVKKHGRIGSVSNQFMNDDPSFPLTSALEVQSTRTVEKDGKLTIERVFDKADIFHRRTIFPFKEPTTASDVSDAMQVSRSWRNRLDLDYMASLTGMSPDAVKAQILEDGLGFENPETGMVESKSDYLSGNVRQKLAQAKAAAENDPAYQSNVTALEAVLPADIPIGQIDVKLGASWVPSNVISQWLNELFDTTGIQAEYSNATNRWEVAWPYHVISSSKNRDTLSGGKVVATDLLEDTLNYGVTTVREKQKDGTSVVDTDRTDAARLAQEGFKERFREWAPKSQYADELMRTYNDRFNSYVDREFDPPTFETYPGASNVMVPRLHQKKAISRGMVESYLNGHAVGTGKTLTEITTAMEWKRLGLAKKPMIVVQNATITQVVQSAKTLYPWATILSPTKRDFEKKNRRRLLSRIATGNYDLIIIPQSQLTMLPDDPAREAGYINEQIDKMLEGLGENERRRPPRQVAQAIKRLEKRLKDVMARQKDDGLTFEQLGIDGILIDEAHEYKKLMFDTKLENIRGLDTGSSQRAFSAFMKMRHIQAKTGGRNTIMLTGTPITNTMGEAWNMIRFVRPDLLAEYGIEDFDAFYGAFTEAETTSEVNPAGELKSITRLSKFKNLPEFLRLWKAASDVINPENTDIERPSVAGGRPELVEVPPTSTVKDYARYLLDRYRAWNKLSGAEKRKQSAEPLVITGLAKKAALDMRLIDKTLPADPGSKMTQAAERIAEIYKKFAEHRAAQAVFSDLIRSDPNDPEAFNVYDALKGELVSRGIPESEIADINAYDTDAKRAKLYELVNKGDIRVVMGSTQKMGVGVNIQERLIALHHLDAPWRPSDMEQREGRIVRQGNMFTEAEIPVHIIRYGTVGTMDSSLFNTLATKQRFINQVIRGEVKDRAIEDDTDLALNFAEAAAALQGDPLLKDRFNTEQVIRRYEAGERQHKQQVQEAKYKIAMAKKDAPRQLAEAADLQAVYDRVKPQVDDGKWEIEIGRKSAEGTKAAAELLDSIIAREQKALEAKVENTFSNNPVRRELSDINLNGLILRLELVQDFDGKGKPYGAIYGRYRLMSGVAGENIGDGRGMTGESLLRSVKRLVHEIPERVEDRKRWAERAKKQAAELQEFIKQPYEHAQQLESSRQELADLDRRIRANADRAGQDTPADIASQSAEQPYLDAVKDAAADEVTRSAEPPIDRNKRSGHIILPELPDWMRRKQEPESTFEFSSDEIEARYREARKGVQVPGIVDKLKDYSQVIWNRLTRTFEHLPKGKQYAEAEAAFLQLQKQRDMQQKAAVRYLEQVTAGLNRAKYDLFTRKVILDDLVEEAGRQQKDRPGKDVRLPFGFDIDSVKDELSRVDSEIEGDPDLAFALAHRRKVWDAVKDDYIAANESIGFKTAKKLTRDSYFRHQVLMYAQTEQGLQGAGRLRTPTGRSFLKQRHGSEADINANYLQAEFQVLAQMLYDTQIAKTLRRIGDNYDIMNRLKKQASIANDAAVMDIFKEMTEGSVAEAEDMYREELNKKTAIGFSKLYGLAADGELPDIDGKYQDLFDAMADVHEEQEAERKAAKAEGRAPVQYALEPRMSRKLWRYMSEVMKQRGEEFEGARLGAATVMKGRSEKRAKIAEMLGENLASWRTMIPEGYVEWQPREGTQFYLANSIPARIAEDLLEGALKEANISASDIRKIMAKGSPFTPFVIPEELAETLDTLLEGPSQGIGARISRASLKHWKRLMLSSPTRIFKYTFRNLTGDSDAVIAANPDTFRHVWPAAKELWSVWKNKAEPSADLKAWQERGGWSTTAQVQELTDIDKLEPFRRMSGAQPSFFLKRIWDGWWKSAASVNDFREAILRYATFLSYKSQMAKHGGRPANFGGSVPEQVMGLKDVDDRAFLLSNEALGAYDAISPIGKNLRSYWFPFWSFPETNFRRYTRMIKNASRTDEYAAIVGKSILGPKSRAGLYTTIQVGKVGMRMMAMWAAMQAVNHLVWPDEEDELPPEVQGRPHIILGRKDNGEILYFDRLGSLGDVLEWFGLDTPQKLVGDLMSGRKDMAETAEDMAFSPINKVVNGLNPFFKSFAEGLSGKTMFPDVRSPKAIRDYGDWLARQLTVEHEFRKVTGRPSPPYLERIENLFAYTSNPDGVAYYGILDEKRRYMKHIGRGTGESDSPRTEALRNFKRAIRYKDEEAATRYLQEYAGLGGTAKGLRQSLNAMDPMFGLSQPERAKFYAWLNEEDRQQIPKAYRYYVEVLRGGESGGQ